MSVNTGMPKSSKCEIQLFELSHQISSGVGIQTHSVRSTVNAFHEGKSTRRKNCNRTSQTPLRQLASVGHDEK